jgi:hypothetical protein
MAPDLPHWPTTIGVIAIAFGALGLVSFIGTTALVYFGLGPDDPSQSTPIMWTLNGLGVLAAAWHVLGGIRTVRRRPDGPRHLIWWAIINSMLVLAGMAHGIRTNLSASNTAAASLGATYTVVILMFSVALSFVWPVFLLVYLTRPARAAHWKSWR